MLEDGSAGHYSVTSEELALACASHSSEPRQVALIRAWLDRIGCSEKDLVCGPHRPLGLDYAIPGAGDPPTPQYVSPTPLSSNCSGNHTALLTLARHHGWPTQDYQRPHHPVQERCRKVVSAWTETPERDIREGTDGCGIVSFRVPLERAALAYARLGASTDAAPTTVRQAMLQHPHLVAGQGRLCTGVMQAFPDRLLAKVGADGVYAASLPLQGIGIVLKVEDGHARAAMVAFMEVLAQLGLPATTAIRRFTRLPIHNTRDEEIGTLRVTGSLTFE